MNTFNNWHHFWNNFFDFPSIKYNVFWCISKCYFLYIQINSSFKNLFIYSFTCKFNNIEFLYSVFPMRFQMNNWTKLSHFLWKFLSICSITSLLILYLNSFSNSIFLFIFLLYINLYNRNCILKYFLFQVVLHFSVFITNENKRAYQIVTIQYTLLLLWLIDIIYYIFNAFRYLLL